MTGGRRSFLVDQLAAAAADVDTRLDVARRTGQVVLTSRHLAAKDLVDALVTAVGDGLSLCDHLSSTTPSRISWAVGMPSLACYLDLLAFAATNHSPDCDICGTPSDGDLHSVMLGVGPIAVVAGLCGPCMRGSRPTSVVDLRAAADQVIAELLRRLEAAQ